MSVTAYTASTFAFNVIVTGLICGRIIYFGRYMQKHYDADTQVYTGAVAIVVESALPFTLFSFAYLITFAIGTDVAFAFSFYAMFSVCSMFYWLLGVFIDWTVPLLVHISTSNRPASSHAPSMDAQRHHDVHNDDQLPWSLPGGQHRNWNTGRLLGERD